jgi:uncharacterized protein (TIGR02679 family)
MNPPDPRLQRLLGGERLADLRRRLRARYEHAPLAGGVERIRIDKLGADDYAALAALLGLPPRHRASLQIDVPQLDTRLRQAGVADSLRDALERLDGPIAHLDTRRQALAARWSGVVEGCAEEELARWLRQPHPLGLLKRLARQDADQAAAFCQRAAAVLRRLPAHGTARAELAAEVLGDAHALDTGQPAATLVLGVLRQRARGADDTLTDAPDGADRSSAAVGGEERVREVWARAGVLVNELARPALYLNLPVLTDRHGGRASGEPGDLAASGEPAYASLRRLMRSPPTWQVAGCDVFVCENPNLLAIAADRLGEHCAPLVCTDGMPAAAQRCLLTQLVQAGARLHYHGDFDWPGLQIGNHLMRHHGARPWRFGAADYAAAVALATGPGHALTGTAVAASWDAALAPAMQEKGWAIAEEAVAAALLADLDRRQSTRVSVSPCSR